MAKETGLDLMWSRIRQVVGDFSTVTTPEAAIDLADSVFRESRHWLELYETDAPNAQSLRELDEIAFLWVPAYLRALDACASVEAHLREHPDPSLQARTNAILDQARAILQRPGPAGVEFHDVRGAR